MQTQDAPSAIDPIPLDYMTLPEVVALRAAAISNRQIEMAFPEPLLQQIFGKLHRLPNARDENESRRMGLSFWRKRELAILEIIEALASARLSAIVWEPAILAFVRLSSEDWHHAAFNDQMIRSGVIRSSTGERTERYEGRRLLVDNAEVLRWMEKRERSKPAPAAKVCADWLKQKMRASPENKPQPKPALRLEAMENFGVSGRQFDAIWKSAIAKTGARWDRRGRPLIRSTPSTA
ncbi:hypothetical protein [Bradyrhizobium sp. OAE829]|uniref:hypothetical protein n=1 Tax=Bradyrhizobium sp. OAE829 TaxID=2663807 RepID=UPI00178C0BBA